MLSNHLQSQTGRHPTSVSSFQTRQVLQRQPERGTKPVASKALSAGIRSCQGGGSALPTSVRTKMENSIGADFSRVRVHDDSKAHQMSTELNAHAFTVGNDVFFNKGKYNPESKAGKHLLAHELTHTVQQGTAIQTQIQKQSIAGPPYAPGIYPYPLLSYQQLMSLRITPPNFASNFTPKANPNVTGSTQKPNYKAQPLPSYLLPKYTPAGPGYNYTPANLYAPPTKPFPGPLDWLKGNPHMKPAKYGKLGYTHKDGKNKLFFGLKFSNEKLKPPKLYYQIDVKY